MTMKSAFGSVFGKSKNEAHAETEPDLSHIGSKFLIFVPAFETGLEKMKDLGKKISLEWHSLNPVKVENGSFAGVTIHREDALKTDEFLFLSAIIEQPELVKNITYNLELHNPVIYNVFGYG